MQTIHLDFQSQGVPPVVPVMQSDSRSRFLGIVLYNGGVPYQAPSGAEYAVEYRSAVNNASGSYSTIADGEDASHPAVTLDADSPHIVTVELAEQALRTPGDVLVNLCVLTSGGYQLSTFPIIVRVTGTACPDATQNNSSGSGLTDEEKALMLSLFQNAAYSASGMQATYSALKTIWDSSGTVDPTPDTPTVIPVTSVTLNKSTLTLTEGNSETLTATVLPSDATNRTVSWTVSPSGYATVSAGKVTAVAAGSCTVKATAGGKSASCAVTVEAAPVGPSEITVDTVTAGTNREWNNSNPLLKSNFVPITAKQDFTVKKLDFQIILTADTSLRINFYSLTDKKDIGTPAIIAGTTGSFHAVAEYTDVACEAGKEYQIWIEAESACMNYPSVFDSMAGENEYFDTTGTAYRYNNSKIRYLGYVVLEP